MPILAQNRLLKTRENLEKAIQQLQQHSQQGKEPESEHLLAVVRCKAEYLRAGKEYAEQYGNFQPLSWVGSFRPLSLRRTPGTAPMDEALLKRADIFDGFFHNNPPAMPDALELPPEVGSATDAIMAGDGTRGNEFVVREFKDKSGKIRPPTYPEQARVMAHILFHKYYSTQVDKALKSGEPVSVKMRESFALLLTDMLELHGITPNRAAASVSMFSEFLILYRDRADKLLSSEMKTHFGDPHTANMRAPAVGQEEKRRQLLRTLEMDPTNLTPPLAEFQKQVLMTALDPTKWREFVTNSGLTSAQGEALSALAQNTLRAHVDIPMRQQWVDSANAAREGKEGQNVLEKAGFYRAVRDSNTLRKAATTEDKTIALAAITSVVTSDMVSTAARGEVNATAVGDSVEAKIIAAYGTPSADMKHTIVVSRAAAQAAIQRGNQEITQHANVLKAAAAGSLAIFRDVFARDLTALAALDGPGVAAIRGYNAAAPTLVETMLDEITDQVSAAVVAIGFGEPGAVGIAVRRAVIAAATNPPLNAPNNGLRSPDSKVRARAQEEIALKASVAGVVAAGVFDADFTGTTGIGFTNMQLLRIGHAVADSAVAVVNHGKAAVTHAIRTQLIALKTAGVHGFVAGAPTPAESEQIEKLTQKLAESASVAYAVQKGETASRAVREKAEVKAVADLVAMQLPKAVASHLCRQFTSSENVDPARVAEQIPRSVGYVNAVLDAIFVTAFAQRHTLGLGALPQPIWNSVAQKTANNYFNNSFDVDQTRAIRRILNEEVERYNMILLTRGEPEIVWPPGEADLTTVDTAIRTAIRAVAPNAIPVPRDYHTPALLPAALPPLVNAVVQAYQVSDQMAEAALTAAAKEAGVSEADAKAVGSAARVAIGENRDASQAAIDKLQVSKDLVAAASVAVLAKNGNGNAVNQAGNNAIATQASIISLHSHDRMAAEADIANVTAAAISEAKQALNRLNPAQDIVQIDIDNTIAKAEEFYRNSPAIIGRAGFLAYLQAAPVLPGIAPAVNPVGTPERAAAFNQIADAFIVACKIQKGIDIGKEAALIADAKGAPLASAIASVASGAGVVHKAAIMAIARDISKHYVDNKDIIDDKTAREKMKNAVALVNTRAENIGGVAFAAAEEDLGEDDAAQKNAIRNDIIDHYLNTGNLLESDVLRIVDNQSPIDVSDADEIKGWKIFYNKLKEAEKQVVAPDLAAPQHTRLTVTQENALAQMVVGFASKTDPAAVGSAVGRAAVQLAATPEDAAANLTVVSALAIRGLGGRTGATLDHADIGNAVLAGRVGTRAAASHIEKLGAAAVVAAAGSAVVRANFAAGYGAIAAAALAAYDQTDRVNGLRPGNPGPRDAAVLAAVTTAAQIAIAQQYTPDIPPGTPLSTPAGGPTDPTAPNAVSDLPKGVPYIIPHGTEKTVAQSVGVAGATVVAAMKAGFSPADAQAMAIAVARPEIVAGGRFAVSKKLTEEMRRLKPALPLVVCNELITAASGGLAIGEGMERVADPLAADVTRGQKLATLIKETAIAAGASGEAANAAAEKAGARMTNADVGAPLDIDAAVLPADRAAEVKAISTLAATALREAGFGDAAFAVSTALSYQLTDGVAAVKNLAASTAAGTSQVTDAESQLAARSAEELAKKIRTGELHNDAAQLAARKQLLAAHAELGQKYGDPPDPQSIDMEHHIHKDQILDAAHADTWTVSYEDGSGRRVALGDDPVLKDCAEALKACCDAEGNSYVTEATVKQAVTEFNKGVRDDQKIRLPQDIKDNGKGGLHLNFHNLVPSQVRDLLMLVAKKSKLTMTPATVEASRPRFGS